ncbi:MAG: WbqC family protein [Candidatus Omnitrophota bacterium]
MNVVIMQPFYLFLRKHFHQIERADLYLFLDDAQFVRRGHHNRNRIKSPQGYTWLTVPVLQKGKFLQKINEVKIDPHEDWAGRHWKTIRHNYARAPFFKKYSDFFEDVYSQQWHYLADLNMHLIMHIASFLGITHTAFKRCSELNIVHENPTQRLIDICEHVGATRYVIGTRAKDYMEEWRWKKTRVQLEYFEPLYSSYPQLWGDFLDNCAIIDLLFNCGPDSGRYIWGPEK